MRSDILPNNKKAPQTSRINIVSLSPIQRDGRVLRQVQYLSRQFDVHVIGYGKLPAAYQDRVGMTSIKPPTSLQRRGRKAFIFPVGRFFPNAVYERWYWREPEFVDAYNALIANPADFIHANDWETLPLATRTAQATGARIILDLHEYAPLMRENRRYWKLFYAPVIDYYLRKHISQVSATITVGEKIAEKYSEEYGFQPVVILNAPGVTEKLDFVRTDAANIHLVHQGVAIRDRKLELMIEVMQYTDPRYNLHLILVDRHAGYIDELKSLAEKLAPDRIFFHPPSLPQEIVQRISKYDIGIYLFPFDNFNSKSALPNKFFEFIAGGLAVLIGPSPEMARLVKKYGFGRVATSFDPHEAATLLNALKPEDIDEMKAKSLQARQILNADVEMAKLVDLYEQLLTGREAKRFHA